MGLGVAQLSQTPQVLLHLCFVLRQFRKVSAVIVDSVKSLVKHVDLISELGRVSVILLLIVGLLGRTTTACSLPVSLQLVVLLIHRTHFR